jgi:hypothetical protein
MDREIVRCSAAVEFETERIAERVIGALGRILESKALDVTTTSHPQAVAKRPSAAW